MISDEILEDECRFAFWKFVEFVGDEDVRDALRFEGFDHFFIECCRADEGVGDYKNKGELLGAGKVIVNHVGKILPLVL